MLKILVVEDSPLMQSVLSDVIDLVGDCTVVAVAGGEKQATQWLRKNRGACDLATIDLNLAEGSGAGLIRRCKVEGGIEVVVVLSDFAEPGVEQACRTLGADAVFSKGQFDDYVDYLRKVRDGVNASELSFLRTQ